MIRSVVLILKIDEQMIRDIDKHPIINSNKKKCQQFGNYQPDYNSHKVKDAKLDIENRGDRIEMLEKEIKSLKLTIESLVNTIESKLNLL
ncbi:hypothetical protein LV89_04350 [Arcicella aurantiaca]|uniref:Uncharacterized protein n=1 Tax=Arcicella aurantiaca TaxID=591202 RepID=A0A316DHR2_9BACT|nr:hypothetical protein [Arcicella aurantiaca]PWK17435.1 hypothetical protein LV89_04350 [Arcicella aurantiaca]